MGIISGHLPPATHPVTFGHVGPQPAQAKHAPIHFGYTGWPTQTALYMKTFPEYAPPPLNPNFHAERRREFMAKLPPNTTVIVPGNRLHQRNNDVDYVFRQDDNFYYLTGFDEPDSIAILSNEPGKPAFTMVVPPRDVEYEIWNGKRAGVAGAEKLYKADKAFSNVQKNAVLKKVIENSQNLMFSPSEANKSLNGVIRRAITRYRPGYTPADPRTHLYHMRTLKTPYEIALMQRAVDISIQGHLKAMKRMKITNQLMQQYPALANGLNEGVIQAEVERPFRQHGAVRLGYPSIGGSGGNACVLHYITNSENAKPGDLVLIDAGAEYGYYTADITRTWPVSGKFTPEQKAIYDIVLDAQETAIQAVKPGVTLDEIHKIAQLKVAEGLKQLGIIRSDSAEEAVDNGEIFKYFMHGTSHTMGMDVHDVGINTQGEGIAASKGREYRAAKLTPGWYFSVEPGIYISERTVQEERLDPKWANIGVRIEDNVLVTPEGHKNLSEALPRKTEELEALMAGPSRLAHALGL